MCDEAQTGNFMTLCELCKHLRPQHILSRRYPDIFRHIGIVSELWFLARGVGIEMRPFREEARSCQFCRFVTVGFKTDPLISSLKYLEISVGTDIVCNLIARSNGKWVQDTFYGGAYFEIHAISPNDQSLIQPYIDWHLLNS